MAETDVLIVEDEPEIAELIAFHVRREGFAARHVASGRAALDRIRDDIPDLVILDLMLPDLDGLEVCRRLKQRAETRHVPIVMVTAKGEESDIVAGIELGAEDYVTKPFSPKVLMARIKNVLRRRDEPGGGGADAEGKLQLSGGALVIDPARHVVRVNGEHIELTLTEFGLLLFLAQRPGFVRTRDQIISAVHGKSTVLSSRTVDVHITALRRKLGELAGMIETVRGVGYRLAEHATIEE
ncbi:MAG TPA: response regulator transcription factor [Phycisphaerales bacterium]|nr:response regulator transcription factor [Phycisphaerales bacterium]HMP37390.1 response regulator transcription factor [Phycisphaerales bacterium]